MKTLLVSIITVVAVQICTSATVPEAERKLDQLRELTSKALEEASIEHNRMSSELDVTTLETKQYGWFEIQKKSDRFLAKVRADRARAHSCRGSRDNIAEYLKKHHFIKLEKCVNQNGKDGVDLISRHKLDLNRYMLLAIDDDEKQIIDCGADEECLDKVLANIDDELTELRHVIADELAIKEHSKENHLEYIRQCASQSIADIELEFSQTPTCVY